MSDSSSIPPEAPRWDPTAFDGGATGSLSEPTWNTPLDSVSSAGINSQETRPDADNVLSLGSHDSSGAEIETEIPIVPYVPGESYQISNPAPSTDTAKPDHDLNRSPWGDGASIPPTSPTSPYRGAIPPGPVPNPKRKSNLGMIIAIVVSVLILLAAFGIWGLMQGLRVVQSGLGDTFAQDFLKKALEHEHRYYSANKRYASAAELSTYSNQSASTSSMMIAYVETEPRAGSPEVKVTTSASDYVCLTARSESGTYWSIGEISRNGRRDTYYLKSGSSDPLSICGLDTISAGSRNGFPSTTPRSRGRT